MLTVSKYLRDPCSKIRTKGTSAAVSASLPSGQEVLPLHGVLWSLPTCRCVRFISDQVASGTSMECECVARVLDEIAVSTRVEGNRVPLGKSSCRLTPGPVLAQDREGTAAAFLILGDCNVRDKDIGRSPVGREAHAGCTFERRCRQCRKDGRVAPTGERDQVALRCASSGGHLDDGPATCTADDRSRRGVGGKRRPGHLHVTERGPLQYLHRERSGHPPAAGRAGRRAGGSNPTRSGRDLDEVLASSADGCRGGARTVEIRQRSTFHVDQSQPRRALFASPQRNEARPDPRPWGRIGHDTLRVDRL